jgi:hypothetical protein
LLGNKDQTPDYPIKLPTTVVETKFTVNATRDDINQLVCAQALQGTPAPIADEEALPYRPMPSVKFMGRSAYLSRLRQYFSAEATAQRRQFLLYGVGGAGKTQICLGFAEANSDLSVPLLSILSFYAHCHA